MKNKIIKWSTPMGVYSIDEDFRVFIGISEDYSAPNNISLQDIIIYVESIIETDLCNYRQGLDAQINMLAKKRDEVDVSITAADFRIKF